MSNVFSSRRPVIFVGATDPICGEAIRFFANATNIPIVLADLDEDSLRQVSSKLPNRSSISIRLLDIFDSDQIRSVLADAALVIQGAQPYHTASTPVLTACIDAKVPYLDYSDDVHSTQESLKLHERAKKEGVPCYINCGSSPGMTNLLAVEIAEELDIVDTLDICWMVSEEGGQLGRDVLEHLMQITGGPCLTWADGKAALHENWVETCQVPMDDSSETLVYESVHPEPVTLPRRFPNVNRIRTLGALNPAPFNGLARGLGAAVNSGTISMDSAIDFLENMQKKSTGSWSDIIGAATSQLQGGNISLNQLYQLASNGATSLKPWNLALWGMVAQVGKGQCSAAESFNFLINYARGKESPRRSGLLLRGIGTHNGQPAVVIKRTPTSSRGSPLDQSMATSIGACCAAFALLALDQKYHKYAGVNCPEDWVKPKEFFKSMEKLGCPRDQIIETL
ncbi:Saccharopine dehydrogenase-domain-containing protein [Penicillium manginii]|jgi:hypothetical protein|uniref:Saccharopine dehydrogenase-domain-containing protein n=1 Tax=Penicillium manginii TaxID=203109 RepID=UPI0025490732|nr:Saccharopine dehydrogenase-domain-containing protein [Penicillium manginii]KAJ5743925.1 Saccharopine dehydrogenase-domain-containing protein [Penicillium manginii]